MEWQAEESMRCPGCGLPRDETMDPQRVDQYITRALECQGCKANGIRHKNWKGDLEGVYLIAQHQAD